MDETILGILFVFFMLAFFFMLGMYNSSKSSKESQYFTYEKAEWQWNSVEEDYCKINNIEKESLTPEDEDKIYEYCGMHMAYFLNWAIRNDFLSKGQRKEKELFGKIKAGEKNACGFLKKIDFKIYREDFKEEILGFIDSYYPMQYFIDYVEIVGSDNSTWCISFDYEKYCKLEERIDDRFQKYKKQNN